MLWQRHNKNDLRSIRTGDIINITGELKNQAVKLGRSPETVFDHWLEFILFNWDIKPEPINGWPYPKEKSVLFTTATRALAFSLSDMLRIKPWYDFLGYIYEKRVVGPGRKSGSGQYFTPGNLADAMVSIANADGSSPGEITDPCCGSGRLLLAAHALNPAARIVAKDLDRTCCMMTAVNLLFHGCVAKIIHGNSLVPDDEREVWLVSPYLHGGDSPDYGPQHCKNVITDNHDS